MKLNGIEIISTSCISELVDDELFLYNDEEKVVVALNKIAKIIWEYIIKNLEMNNDISTNDIAIELICLCGEPVPDVKEVSNDIDETIERFLQASLIKKVEHE